MAAMVRIGLLGASRIAPPAVIDAAHHVERVEVVAVAARDRHRAEAFAADHGVAEVFDSYEALVGSDRVDAVYVGLPPSGHEPWTVAALEAGKHVLCEKPFACTTAQALHMVEVAERTGLVLCEAFHWRYHPLATRLAEVLTGDLIGPVRHIEAVFSVPITDLSDLRHDPRLGGGAMMDLGCYAVQWARFAARGEPEVERVEVVEGGPGIDLSMEAILRFDDGAEARVVTSMAPDTRFEARLEVSGVDGTVSVDNPLAPHLGHRLVIDTSEGQTSETVDGEATYVHQLRAFVAAVLDGEVLPTGGVDAVATMRIIEDCYAQAGLPVRGD